ncbi:PhoH family protein [Achromobacter sp. GG226]|uniref:PhoH family protein n=1 Tax=Verticiella alkaliphila TaxID=2779529 RepID=UPI001C0E4B74|nr:PhoH family protein [Verticiella sp. GG226]MBU4612172.1 PhoH family protein [Verticiella sp. GG226]
MPLPKMPTRPATILPAPEKAPALTTRRTAKLAAVATPEPAEPLQPELAGLPPSDLTPAKPARKSARKSSAAGVLLQPAPSAAATPVADVTDMPASPPAIESRAPAQPAVPTARQSDALDSPRAVKPTPAARTRQSSRANNAATASTARKLFVLDTNVLMHDPSSLFRFEEHDVFLPMMTLEELDHNKKGMSEVARNARQVSRTLDTLITDERSIAEGVPLSSLGNREAKGKLLLQTRAMANGLPAELPVGKADNQILGVVHALQGQYTDREVVLVSKDINMRLKARALGMAAEDYFNDQVLEDADLLYSGIMALPEDFWNRHGKGVESWQQGGSTFYRINGPLCEKFHINQFVYFEGSMPLYAQVRELNGRTAVLQTLRDYTHNKNNVWGITARNREQNFALNLLMNTDCDFVSLLGQAGTGKTLLALAAGLTQVLETKRFTEIIMTRVTVPVGEDIGFLPGTEEEKMLPWMGALEDNLDVLNMGDGEPGGGNHGGEWGRAATMDLIRSRIKVKSLNFMRGRTFLNKFLIIDEAQNLTPKQMKTLITRAGPGTKVVCLGNIAQIDTPYLTEGSSGLTYVVDRFKGWPHSGHVTLQRGERSRLADYAADIL